MKHNLNCHCGAVQIEVLSDLENIKQCNCSICKRKNAKMAMVSKESLSIIKGKEYLTSYKFNTMIAEHFFCKICGIYTHHRSYTNPENYEYNIGCIDNIDSFEYKNIPVFDGEKL